MTEQEKEKCKMVLRTINKEFPKGTDCYDEYGGTIAHRPPTKEALAIADMAGILYLVLNTIEVTE